MHCTHASGIYRQQATQVIVLAFCWPNYLVGGWLLITTSLEQCNLLAAAVCNCKCVLHSKANGVNSVREPASPSLSRDRERGDGDGDWSAPLHKTGRMMYVERDRLLHREIGDTHG